MGFLPPVIVLGLLVPLWYLKVNLDYRRDCERAAERRRDRAAAGASADADPGERNPDFDFADAPSFHQILTKPDPPPGRHGLTLALMVVLPALVFLVLWLSVSAFLALLGG